MAQRGPELSSAAALEITRIHGAIGTLKGHGLVLKRPFRAPHHTITRAGLVGGGVQLRPGEVTLAHEGVLFLDEVSEFAPAVLDGLREPMADAQVSMVRGTGARVYPARFQLLAAMNPCRCGFLGSSVRSCRCTAGELSRYHRRLSGPLLDRIEIFVEVGPWQGDFIRQSDDDQNADLIGGWRENPSLGDLKRAHEALRNRSAQASYAKLAAPAQNFLDEVRVPMGLSLRGIERCVAVAETAAALDGAATITKSHVREALEFRRENLVD